MSQKTEYKEFTIEGMDCTDCARHLEDTVGKLQGIKQAKINFMTAKLHVIPDERFDSETNVIKAVKTAGYKAIPEISTSIVTRLSVTGLDSIQKISDFETKLEQTDGVERIKIRAEENEVLITHKLSMDLLLRTLTDYGYSAEIRNRHVDQSDSRAQSSWKKSVLVILSGIFVIAGAITQMYTSMDLPAILLILAGIVSAGTSIAKKGLQEARHLKPGMNFLMTIAVLGAMSIGEWTEAGMVVFLFSLAQLLETRSMEKARRSINALIDQSPKTARIIEDQIYKNVPVGDVQIGQKIAVKPGETIPLDGIVLKGKSHVDQSNVTGESFPVTKDVDDRVYAGTLNKNGYLEIHVDRPYAESTFSRIIHLVIEAQAKKAPKQAFIDRFSQYYTPIVIGIAILIAVLPPLFFDQPFIEWFYRALVVLVIACPCALVISTPVTIVSGLTAAVRKGLLIKGGIFLENFARVDAIAFDKTGTLTEGKPGVQSVITIGEQPEKDVLIIAASLESKSQHPLAEAIVNKSKKLRHNLFEVVNFRALEGKGIEGEINGKRYLVGNHQLFEENGWCDEKIHHILEKVEDEKHTAILVGNDQGVLGVISINDALREQSVETVKELTESGIEEIVLLTGDNHRTAEKVAAAVGIKTYHAELLPEDKVAVVNQLKKTYQQVAMVGDGVNDAPSLAAADIGIAMGAGSSDAALDTADIILMKDDLNKIKYLKSLSHQTRRIIKQNIVIALGLKFIFLTLAIPGVATLWMAVFADMGASLLVIFNGLRTLRGG